MASGPDHVQVTTNPAGATLLVDNVPVGQTPFVAKLDRVRSKGDLRLELPGFESVTILRDKSVNGWIWGNLLLGGLIGVVIDLSTGNATRFDDTPISIGLTPMGGGAALPPPVGGAALPPGASDPECKEERHRVFVEAKEIRNRDERLRVLRSAPVCKDP
jgi:hypothetical protein